MRHHDVAIFDSDGQSAGREWGFRVLELFVPHDTTSEPETLFSAEESETSSSTNPSVAYAQPLNVTQKSQRGECIASCTSYISGLSPHRVSRIARMKPRESK